LPDKSVGDGATRIVLTAATPPFLFGKHRIGWVDGGVVVSLQPVVDITADSNHSKFLSIRGRYV
jgi:hypothetical protein